MSLANFFSKSAMAAAQILKSYDMSLFEEKLSAEVVGLFFDEDVVTSCEGRTTCELTVNILSRLYPRIAICTNTPDSCVLSSQLKALALSINPSIEIYNKLDEATLLLVVGSHDPSIDVQTFFIGSRGWNVHLSANHPVGSAESNNPFGASAAACFGAANAFRYIFSSQLMGAIDEELSLSLLTYARPDESEFGNFPDEIDIGAVHLIGAGAIGNSFLWALSRGLGFTGKISVVDHEEVDQSNLQRYVLADQSTVGIAKVSVACDALSNSPIDVEPHGLMWQSYMSSRQGKPIDCAIVALDSAAARVDVQATLPRFILNSWTQEKNLGVSRHVFSDELACLACMYAPDSASPSESDMVAQAFGLPVDDMEVRSLLYKNSPIEQGFVDRISEIRPEVKEQIQTFVGEPLRSFYQKAICGGVILSAPISGSDLTSVEVPMAFQSALAGVMLASELVLSVTELREGPMPMVTSIDLLSPVGDNLSYSRKPDASASCLCQDPDYVLAYSQHHKREGQQVEG
jgi:hypothetical protein